jgi:hypothetical protein
MKLGDGAFEQEAYDLSSIEHGYKAKGRVKFTL